MESRYKNIVAAIEYERAAEEAHYKALSANKSIAERIESGILWYPLSPIDQVYTVGEQIEMTFERTKHLDKSHKLRPGMGCHLFKMDSTQRVIELRATISYVKKHKISIILSQAILSKNDLQEVKGNLGIELIHDERPYKVMLRAMEEVAKSNLPHIITLKEGIARKDTLAESRRLEYEVKPDHLNHSQVKALNGCLNANNIAIIHGPPGTGKTTTLVSVVKSLLKSEKTVLVCAPSNNAVDLLAKHLSLSGLSTLRVGNVTRIADDLTHLTLAEKARAHPEWQHIKKVRIEAGQIRKQASRFKRKFSAEDRAERKFNYREASDLMKWAKDLERKLTETLIREAQVVCTTLIGVSARALDDFRFKTLVIDEASQALEPECWNAMLKAERVILAGDHLQLAPTVKSKKAEALGLTETLLTRLTDKIHHTYLLNVQYRMHEKILSFSNRRFYQDKLISDSSNSQRCLPSDEAPLVFVDTSGCGFDEIFNPKTLSRKNEGEYFILREHFLQHKDLYEGASIGIISPYSEQVKYLRSSIEEEPIYQSADITVNSIDGFQGQEKDVIYITLVRSNMQGEIGFLADERRLNVAMTRAKKKLIIIGDMSTLSKSELFTALADHVEAIGVYQSAWEYMGESFQFPT